ncbi:AraC family transcriptional regulator [Bacillus sp. SM2101]|uniref:AraC family transcriptional regulator n=1 Tax=Bacillus sp. SM2101 TaxID=2805366 RepID=UPI001BDEC720|nr:AraC family transcriptional regulator [Bacillus sp. SM2101]
MNIIKFPIPPFPLFVNGGQYVFNKGDRHFRRTFPVFDLLYVKYGKIFITTNDVQYEINEGQYLIILPGEEHYGHKDCIEGSQFIWLHFQYEKKYDLEVNESIDWSNIVQNIPSYIEPANLLLKIPQYAKIRKKEYMERLMDRIIASNDLQNPELYLYQQIYFQEFFVQLQKEAMTVQNTSEKLTEQVIVYIKNHFQDQVTLDNIARDLLYHPDYITRCMKRTIGVTPIQFLTQYRLSQAKHMLTISDETINSISKGVGIKDYAHFSKLFKLHVGVSPAIYRKETQRK